MSDSEGKKAYEIGSGESFTDVSDVMLARARERCGNLTNVSLVQTAGEDLPTLEDASLDVVYSFACFIHLPQSVQKAYEREIVRVLRPGGLALIHVRHNQPLGHYYVRTYSGDSYNDERLDEIRRMSSVRDAQLIPIERSDDLVQDLDHRRWLLIRRS